MNADQNLLNHKTQNHEEKKMKNRIIRLPDVIKLTGLKRSSIYIKVNEGLLPAPIKISKRAIGWPMNEIQQVVDAIISGASSEDVYQLVLKLMEERG